MGEPDDLAIPPGLQSESGIGISRDLAASGDAPSFPEIASASAGEDTRLFLEKILGETGEVLEGWTVVRTTRETGASRDAVLFLSPAATSRGRTQERAVGSEVPVGQGGAPVCASAEGGRG